MITQFVWETPNAAGEVHFDECIPVLEEVRGGEDGMAACDQWLRSSVLVRNSRFAGDVALVEDRLLQIFDRGSKREEPRYYRERLCARRFCSGRDVVSIDTRVAPTIAVLTLVL